MFIGNNVEKAQADQKTLVIATVVSMPYVSTKTETGFLSLIAKEMFSRIGRNVQIIRLPGERALDNVNSGIEDGELFRIGGMEKTYKNLVPVPEPLMKLEFIGYTLAGKSFPVNGWNSLKPYNVGIINGWKIYELNVIDVRSRIDVRSMDLLFGLLKNDRADVVLADRWQGIYVSKKLGIKFEVLSPSFAEHAMFMYLHKSHLDLVKPLADALIEMKKSGIYKKIYDDTLGQLNLKG